MNRVKEYQRVNIFIKPDIYRKIKLYSLEKHIRLSELMEQMIEYYLINLEELEEGD